MNKKEYAELLKNVIQLQINYTDEELKQGGFNTDYLQGVKTGLQIAIQKIEASMFLTDKE